MASEQMNISLSLTSSPSSPRIPLTISPNDTTPSHLHSLASEASRIPLDKLKIIFRGRLIPKNDTEGNAVALFLLEEGCVVHCMGRPVAEQTSPSVVDEAVGTAASGVAASVVRPPPASAASTAATVAANTGGGGGGNGGGGGDPLKTALETMKSTHDAKTYATGVATLCKILENIVSNPNEEKYRRVKRSNPAFQKRLGSLHGSEPAMLAIGFTIQNTTNTNTTTTTTTNTGEYVLVPSAEAWPKLLQSQTVLQTANTEAQRSSLSSSSNAFPTSSSTPGTNPPLSTTLPTTTTNLPPFPPLNGASNPAALTESLLQNPSQFTALLQNPMVRSMMENDPNIANNPMAQQSLRMMQENPQMVESAMRMMGDNPELRRAFLENAGGLGGTGGGGGGGFGGLGGGLGGGWGGVGGVGGGGGDMDAMRRQMEMMRALSGVMNTNTGSSSVPSQPSSSGTGMTGGSTGTSNNNNNNTTTTNSNTSGGGGDAEMTEEEMIAEAIARSLRES